MHNYIQKVLYYSNVVREGVGWWGVMEWSDGGGSGGVRGRVRGREELGRGEELRRGEELGRGKGVN